MFKSNLSENAKKRINILKESTDGFYISEEDMKIRGFGDILGFKQSGIKNFKLADPIHNSDLFLLAEKEIRKIELDNADISKYKPLIKLYDRADIINDIALRLFIRSTRRNNKFRRFFKSHIQINHVFNWKH
jgi:ATP-dependent DNA helicase RecG